MKHVSKCVMILAGVAAFVLLTTPLPADWNPGDPYKYLQSPDPTGWDVEIYGSNNTVADDWQCNGTGPVSDIHFWTSWAKDNIDGETHPWGNVPGPMDLVWVGIAADVPAGTDKPYSHPGQLLWSRFFSWDQCEFTIRPYGVGDQGFTNKTSSNGYVPHDHQLYQQVNIANIDNPFIQQEGQIYWLEIFGSWDGIEYGTNEAMGWKTSQDHALDAAAFYVNGSGWYPLDPQYWPQPNPSTPFPAPPYRFDMAFVITPEPSTVILFGIGILGLLGFAWRQRKRTA
jgi:hypothetical protein